MARASHVQRDDEDSKAALREEASRLADDPEDRMELVLLRDELDEWMPEWSAD